MASFSKGNGALKRTFEYLGYGSPAQDELDEFEVEDTVVKDDDYGYETEPQHSNSQPTATVTPLPARSVETHSEPADLRRIVTISPESYNQAKEIGEAFRDGTPVIMNLSGLGDQEARRMVDFAAGLIFGLQGSIEKVTSRVFLLSPKTVEVEVNEQSHRRSWFKD